MRTVGYTKSGKKIRRNSKGKWKTSKGKTAKFYSATKPKKSSSKTTTKRRRRRTSKK